MRILISATWFKPKYQRNCYKNIIFQIRIRENQLNSSNQFLVEQTSELELERQEVEDLKKIVLKEEKENILNKNIIERLTSEVRYIFYQCFILFVSKVSREELNQRRKLQAMMLPVMKKRINTELFIGGNKGLYIQKGVKETDQENN